MKLGNIKIKICKETIQIFDSNISLSSMFPKYDSWWINVITFRDHIDYVYFKIILLYYINNDGRYYKWWLFNEMIKIKIFNEIIQIRGSNLLLLYIFKKYN